MAMPVLGVPAPAPSPQEAVAPVTPAAAEWWLGSMQRRGVAAFGAPGYKVFRNVKDFGARGDGVTDDTAAINLALSQGGRCGQGCDSSTTTPGLVYFPNGIYVVSSPIIMYYYSQIIGDPNNRPTIKASPGFAGMAVIDANPYDNFGNNWHTNQNNFFRQIRNIIIDLTAQPFTTGTGIHWQVAQATSLQNIQFNMRTDGGEANAQQGLFIDNGSGGFMTDLTFTGGRFGMFVGSQQFTTRNMIFNNCRTAIFMNWNWAWTFQNLRINNCGIGIDMANGGNSQTVGSVILADSVLTNTQIGVSTAYNPGSPHTNGSLILDNVDMSANVPQAVARGSDRSTILAGNQRIASWMQGRAYSGLNGGQTVQGTQNPVNKPAALLDASGKIVTRSRPQFESLPSSSFISVKANGAIGNGIADDTAAIQAIFDRAGPNDVVFFDHGAYIITDTVRIPPNIRITGEIWPLIMAGGNSAFKDQNNPKPVFKVGQPGDVGTVEITDLIFETQGAQPGAILMEWNVAGSTPGSAGLWDVHFRIGGSAGTQLQSDKCVKNPTVIAPANPECIGAFMILHVTPQGSGYFENTWFWVADHELDRGDHSQINIYNGRGVLIESTKGVWLWGTASEHNVLYNYQISNAANVYMALIQTETAYFQGNPDSKTPFTVNARFKDPSFDALCAGKTNCARTWGVRVTDSTNVFVYGAGLYSFFDNYSQVCLNTQSCQEHMVSIENSAVHMYAISTKAAVNMLTVNGQAAAFDRDNRNNFCATLAVFHSG
jgi:glucan 1,3-beta-glucosidase